MYHEQANCHQAWHMPWSGTWRPRVQVLCIWGVTQYFYNKEVSPKTDITLNELTAFSADSGTNLELNMTNERLCQLQQEDPFCKRIMGLLKSSKLQASNPYYIEDKLLMRIIIDNKQCFHTIVLPWLLITQILMAVHDELGHSGTTRTYMLVHRPYYWKGLKASANKHSV